MPSDWTPCSARSLIDAKLDALGFGFLVPVFFVNTGVSFDLDALLDSPTTLAPVPTFLVLFIVVRGIPATFAAPVGSSWRDRIVIALFGATGLPIIVAVTAIGVEHGELQTSTAAALIGAGMLSVLLLPLIGLKTAAQIVNATEDSSVMISSVRFLSSRRRPVLCARARGRADT